MYALLQHLGTRKGVLVEALSLAVSLVCAEFFYKFHSFTLECMAFLATWLAVSYVATRLSEAGFRKE